MVVMYNLSNLKRWIKTKMKLITMMVILIVKILNKTVNQKRMMMMIRLMGYFKKPLSGKKKISQIYRTMKMV